MDQYIVTKEQFDAITKFKDEQIRYKPNEMRSGRGGDRDGCSVRDGGRKNRDRGTAANKL
ncbi:3158_t:CDS:2 [Rhizophagus irregularis]|nr:3158_t:CDS:2 [Rhizophagus irregularis]